MQYDQFIGKVQNLAHLPTRHDAERAVNATLECLGERLPGGTAHNLAAQLPADLGRLLIVGAPEPALTVHDFFLMVARREGTPPATAAHHARAVIDVLREAVSSGAFEHVRDQMPPDWRQLWDGHSVGSPKAHA